MLRRQSKHWIFVINNPRRPFQNPPIDFESWRRSPLFAIYQLEIGENGTPHFQGYVSFKIKIRGDTLSNYFGCKPNLRVRNGKHSEAKAYSEKEDTRQEGPWIYGDDTDIPEGAGARTDVLRVKRKIDEGATIKEIATDDELHGVWIRHHRAIAVYKRLKSVKRRWPMEIITLIGETGTGKSRWANDTFPDIYAVATPKGSGTYFDDYDDHKQVLFEEMDGSYFSYKGLLKFTDRYPISVPVHHGCVNLNADTIVFTSNDHPDEWYDSIKFPWMGGPLQRRMTTNGSRIYRVDMGGVLNLLEGEEPVVEGPKVPRGIYPINNPNP